MKHYAKINIVLHLPADSQSAQALTKATAEVHAAAVVASIRAIDCTAETKAKILDSICNLNEFC